MKCVLIDMVTKTLTTSMSRKGFKGNVSTQNWTGVLMGLDPDKLIGSLIANPAWAPRYLG